MNRDYTKANSFSYNKFIELYEENEIKLKKLEEELTEEIKKEVARIEVLINAADCTDCARAGYQTQIDNLYSTTKPEIAQYKKEKAIIINHLVNKNLVEELKKIADIDEKLKHPIKKKVVKKNAAKSK